MTQAGGPPAGLMSHVVYPHGEGFVVADVWRTRAEGQPYVDEVLRPLLVELGLTAPEGHGPSRLVLRAPLNAVGQYRQSRLARSLSCHRCYGLEKSTQRETNLASAHWYTTARIAADECVR